MTIEQTLLQEIKESKTSLNFEKDESTSKQDLAKRIELINWVLENIKNPDKIETNLRSQIRYTMSGVCYDFEKWTIVSFAIVAITQATGLCILALK